MPRVTYRADEGDGSDLRHILIDGVEVAARIYFAVRTDRWLTVPFETVSRAVTVLVGEEGTDDGFTIDVVLRSTDPDYPVDATLRFTTAGSTITATSSATAHDGFRYNRIGLCLLHPIHNHVGRAVSVSGGLHETEGTISERISPQLLVDGDLVPMFGTDFGRLRISLEHGELDATFDGDTFEVEDQRNWSDASLKSYSTPLRAGTQTAFDGQEFAQSITLTFTGSGQAPAAPTTPVVGEVIGVLPPVSVWAGPPDGTPYRPDNGFPVINREQPTEAALAGHDSVAFGILGSVHAADDASVLETGAIHGTMIRQVRELTHGLPVHVGPLDFDAVPGEWFDDAGYTPAPPASPADPRRTSAFGAAWVVASLASAAASGAASLGYFDGTVAGSPAGELLDELSGLAGQPVREITATDGVAAVAIGDILYEADLTPPYQLRKGATPESG